MNVRNIDAPSQDDLSYMCSRQHEDYLDWLENQDRASWDLVKAVRVVAGTVVGLGALAWAAFLVF
jgi:hypothetical protein